MNTQQSVAKDTSLNIKNKIIIFSRAPDLLGANDKNVHRHIDDLFPFVYISALL